MRNDDYWKTRTDKDLQDALAESKKYLEYSRALVGQQGSWMLWDSETEALVEKHQAQVIAEINRRKS